jgi:hypothetical protein
VRPASIRRSASFRPHLLVIPHCFENGGKQASRCAGLPPQTVQHKLRDGSIPDHVGPAQHLKVPGHGGLGQIENGLKIGYKQWRRRQTVQDPEPGGLGDREQKIGRGGCGHIRGDEYKRRREDGKDPPMAPGEPPVPAAAGRCV